ncbi:MAG: 1,4-dihydroxy-2-naphthoate polyprenyltransferase [Flavobacteriaceae bacterium]|nr:1,4-dihydroxy-2-naphthoate polyprenyltransferase [Flavobacteriaceae bacterium]
MKPYIQAARLRTLPLSVSGIIVGSFLAASEKAFDWKICVLALATTIAFQILSNYANDYGDGVKGTDNKDRVGPERALQSGAISQQQMHNAIKITGGLSLLLALFLIYVAFGQGYISYDLLFLVLAVAAIAAAIKYTIGKKAYGYSGFGDIFVFVFFGLVSVFGSYFLYTKQFNILVLLPAFSVGLLSVGVLNLNNMRDLESDTKAQKNTLAVKIGAEFAKYYHYYLLITAFILTLIYTSFTFKSAWQFLFILAFIPIFKQLLTVYNTKDLKKLDPELKKLALSTFLFALLFGLGQIM